MPHIVPHNCKQGKFMGWWFKLRCKVRRLFGLYVPVVAYRDTFENGEFFS